MKLQFKHQKFQADAAKAVVDVFAGQPYLTPTYMMDRGSGTYQIGMEEEHDFTGWRNERIVPELSDALILEHLNKIQRANQIAPSPKLEGRYNLTIEMETGVGKTYTYIKTMFELNKHYGWSKFIIVVPNMEMAENLQLTKAPCLFATVEPTEKEEPKKPPAFLHKKRSGFHRKPLLCAWYAGRDSNPRPTGS